MRLYFDSLTIVARNAQSNDSSSVSDIHTRFQSTDLATGVRASVFRLSPWERVGVAGEKGYLGKSIRIYPPVTGQLGLILRDKRIEI